MHVLLTGFMGSGKTFFMKKLKAHSKDREHFLDLDEEILRRENLRRKEKGLSTFFHFEDLISSLETLAFRDLEEKTLFSLLETYQEEDLLLSLGGGTLSSKNISRVLKRRELLLCFLDTKKELCLKRIEGDKTRPLAYKKTREDLFALYFERLSIYQRAKLHLNEEEQMNLKTLDELIRFKA